MLIADRDPDKANMWMKKAHEQLQKASEAVDLRAGRTGWRLLEDARAGRQELHNISSDAPHGG